MKTLLEMKSGLHRPQDSELFERTLNNDEIEALIDKARESALAIKKDKKRNKEERGVYGNEISINLQSTR